MSNIVIATYALDIHATAVALGLEQLGHGARIWFPNDLPQQLSATLMVGPDELSFIDSNGHRRKVCDEEIFWHRRLGAPVVSEILVDVDRQLADRECRQFMTSIVAALEEQCISVNKPSAARAAEDKYRQLCKAKASGLSVPRTLITNDPTAIREFVSSSKTRCIVKPFRQIFYKTKTGTQEAMFTSSLSIADLPEDRILRQCPAIYQDKIEKAFELRIHCMGSHVCAVKLDSQSVLSATLDWRAVQPDQLSIRLYDLPSEWTAKCLALTHSLGLLFGCIDAIVTVDGELIFLEINQMGQFLWVESANKNILLLDMFTRFLSCPSKEFTYIEPTNPLRYEAIAEQAWIQASKHRDEHVPRVLDDVYFRE